MVPLLSILVSDLSSISNKISNYSSTQINISSRPTESQWFVFLTLVIWYQKENFKQQSENCFNYIAVIWGGAVCSVTMLQVAQLRKHRSIPSEQEDIFFSSKRADRLKGPTILLVDGYFPLEQSRRGVKLTIHLHLVPSQLSDAIRRLPCPPS